MESLREPEEEPRVPVGRPVALGVEDPPDKLFVGLTVGVGGGVTVGLAELEVPSDADCDVDEDNESDEDFEGRAVIESV